MAGQSTLGQPERRTRLSQVWNDFGRLVGVRNDHQRLNDASIGHGQHQYSRSERCSSVGKKQNVVDRGGRLGRACRAMEPGDGDTPQQAGGLYGLMLDYLRDNYSADR
ncbi:hypothetical protein [Bradyrhizobium pachyrhizi]|uniref:hypothetical protein n=1 Tax=Bradyrhizobium pachyrhizi TaxID=280333 RepID=UPI00128FBC7C|nr:hypothetical protein [Bradyrhizobium pachyrhizi]